MKNRKQLKGRTLTDQDLKGVLGGITSPTPSPVPNDQSPDARAQVIETGAS